MALAMGCDKAEAPRSESRARPAAEQASTPSTESDDARGGAQRMVIRTASLELTVDQPKAVSAMLIKRVEARSGFVVDSVARGESRASVKSTLRVPAEDFEVMLSEIRELGAVEREEIRGEDVTEQIVDLEARLRSQRKLEQRMLGLLDQSQDIEAILKVEQELSRVRTEIERMEGKRQSLRDRVQLATIDVSLMAPRDLSERGRSLWREIGDAFKDGRKAAIFVIGGVVRVGLALLPLILFGALGFWIARFFWRRRKERKNAYGDEDDIVDASSLSATTRTQ